MAREQVWFEKRASIFRGRGKKPEEGVWGNLRSRFPQGACRSVQGLFPLRGRVVGWLSASPLGVSEPIALAVALDDVTAMGEPIEGCAGQSFAAEDLGPVFEG